MGRKKIPMYNIRTHLVGTVVGSSCFTSYTIQTTFTITDIKRL